MPQNVCVVASKIPDTGFTTKPVRPFSPPRKNPPMPLYWAPYTGEVNRPVTPLAKPLAILFAPFAKP